jgi:acetolactate synthase-1/2/3 large subunit
VLDGGETAAWAAGAVGDTHIVATLSLGYQGHLGVGQGYAIGAQIACPERRVLQITGDGAIGFHIQEWDTMVRHRLPIVTVVFNNACWGMSIHGQEAVGGAGTDVITKLAPTSYEIVAQGFGAHGELVERLEDLGSAIRRAFAAGAPAVVNVRVSASVVHPVTTMLLGDLTAKDEIVVPYYQNIPR